MLLATSQQHFDERPERPSPVGHAVLRRGRGLGEAHPEIGREEQGVVPEPAGAARLGEHAAFGRRLDELRCRPLLWCREVEDAAEEKCACRVAHAPNYIAEPPVGSLGDDGALEEEA